MKHRANRGIVRLVTALIFVIGGFTVLAGQAAAQRANNPGQPFEQLETKLDELESKTDTVDGKLNALETKADALEGKADTIGSTAAAVSGKVDTLQTTADGIDTAVGILEGKADRIEAAASTIDTNVMAVQGAATTINGKVDALAAKADAIQAAVGTIPTPPDISGLQNAVGAIEAKLDALVIPPPTNITGLESAVAALETKNDSLETKLDALETKLDALAAAVANLATGSTTDPQCGSGQRFIDKGLTVFDCKENLEWEKKTSSNVSEQLTWSTTHTGGFDGGAADYIDALNTPPSDTEPCFAERCDWRLPQIAELLTIADCTFSPCINPIFGPTHNTFSAPYWSATPVPANPDKVWVVQFLNGTALSGMQAPAEKDDPWYVRAVRSGP